MKRKAYELSVSGQYDGLFKLTDQQRPGEGDVSVLRVRIPPQFEMSGELSIDVKENHPGQQVLSDGGTGLAFTPSTVDQGVATTGLYEWTTNSWSSEDVSGTTYQRHPAFMLTGSLEDGWSTENTAMSDPAQTISPTPTLASGTTSRPNLSYPLLLDFRTEPIVNHGSDQDYAIAKPSRSAGSYPDGFNLTQSQRLEIASGDFDDPDPYSLHLRFNFVNLTPASSGDVYLLRTTHPSPSVSYPEVDVKLNASNQLQVILESDPSDPNPNPTLTLPYEVSAGRWYNLIVSFVAVGANYRADAYLDVAQEGRIFRVNSVNLTPSHALPVLDEVFIGEGYTVKVTHFSFIEDSFSGVSQADEFTNTLLDGGLTSDADAVTVYGTPPKLNVPNTSGRLLQLTYHPPLVSTVPTYELYGYLAGTHGGTITAGHNSSVNSNFNAYHRDGRRYPFTYINKSDGNDATESAPITLTYTPLGSEVLTQVEWWDISGSNSVPRYIKVIGHSPNTIDLLATFDKGASPPYPVGGGATTTANRYANMTFSNTTAYTTYELQFYDLYQYGAGNPSQTQCEFGDIRLNGYRYDQPTTITVSGVRDSQEVTLGSISAASYAPSGSTQSFTGTFNSGRIPFDSYVLTMSGGATPYKLGKFAFKGTTTAYPGLNDDGTLTDYYWTDVVLPAGEYVDAVTFWPHRTDYALFPQAVQVWGKAGAGASTRATSSDTFVPTSADPAWTLLGSHSQSSAPSNPGGAGPTDNNKVATIDLPDNAYTHLRIRVNKGGVASNTVQNYFRIGEVQIDFHTDFRAGHVQTRLPQPLLTGGWFANGGRLYLHDQVAFVSDGARYRTVAHGGTVTATTQAFNSLDARAEIQHLFMDAFTNRTSTLDTINDVTTAPYDVEGLPSFVMEADGGRVDVYVDYTPFGGRLRTLRLVGGTYTAGYHSVTHRTAFIAMEPGTYQLNTDFTVGVSRLAVVDHYERPTLTFGPTGDSAYGLATLDMNSFDGTITCNTLLNRRLGFPDVPLIFQHGKVQGITSLNDVRRISMYLEPSIQYHVSSHVNNQADMAEDTLTVISFSITGDDLTDSAIYALTSDFDVNSAKMTSNKSSAIQFKIFKEVYDSVNKEFRVEPIRMGPNDYAEVKLVVTHQGDDYEEGG